MVKYEPSSQDEYAGGSRGIADNIDTTRCSECGHGRYLHGSVFLGPPGCIAYSDLKWCKCMKAAEQISI